VPGGQGLLGSAHPTVPACPPGGRARWAGAGGQCPPYSLFGLAVAYTAGLRRAPRTSPR